MKDYQIYTLDSAGINQQELIEYVQLSKQKFNHLYRGFEHATKFYYLYNFYTIASCNSNVYKLYCEVVRCIRHYFNLYEIPKTNIWMQSWMNIHKQTEVLTSHSHEYDFHGYISLSNHITDTVFTDGQNGTELYRVANAPLQLYLGPGRRHHHVTVGDSFDDERITLGMDLQITDTITDNFSFIPVII
jgi:hypothetical protein